MLVVYRGALKTIVWAESSSGTLGLEYFNGLNGADQRKFDALFHWFGDSGKIRNEQKFRKERDHIWAFKSFQHRLYCFFDGADVVITHGVQKKSDKASKADLDRADRIRIEYLAAKGKKKK